MRGWPIVNSLLLFCLSSYLQSERIDDPYGYALEVRNRSIYVPQGTFEVHIRFLMKINSVFLIMYVRTRNVRTKAKEVLTVE